MLRAYKFSIFLGIIILIVSIIPVHSVPKIDIKAIDKIGHFLAYGCLGFAVIFETTKKLRWPNEYRRWLNRTIPFCMLFGVGIEILQGSPMVNRHFDYIDMLANSLGAIAGSIIFIVLFKSLKKNYIN